MFVVIVSEKGGSAERHEFQQSEVTIGRVQGNDIILGKGNVSKRHSRLVLKDGRFIVVDLKSTNGTFVNGRKVTSPLVVKPGDKIYIGDFTLSLEGGSASASNAPGRRSTSEEGQPPVGAGSRPGVRAIEGVASQPASLGVPGTGQAPAVRGSPVPAAGPIANPFASPIAKVASSAPPRTVESPRPAPKTWEPPVRGDREASSASRSGPGTVPPMDHGTRAATKHTSAFEVASNVVGDRNLRAVMARLESEFDIYDCSADSMGDEARWTEAERAAERAVRQLASEAQLDESDHGTLAAAAVREAVGLGVLESLLADDRVREILVSSPSSVSVDFGQGAEPATGAFSDTRMLTTVARRLAAQAGVDFDKSAPSLAFILPSGALVTVMKPPLALHGPVIEIRRIRPSLSLDELVASHSLSSDGRAALIRAVQSRRNIAVIGPSGSGVTTVIAAIAGVMPVEDRVVIASSIPDMRLDRSNVVALTAGLGRDAGTLADVIVHGARLRADRLLIDAVGPDEIQGALTRLTGRAGGDVIGICARPGIGAIDTIRRTLELAGNTGPRADALIAETVSIIVELDSDHGLRRVRRIVEVQVGADGRLDSGDAPA